MVIWDLEFCWSILNKGPFIHDLIKYSLDILALTETPTRLSDTNILNSPTPPIFNFIQQLWNTGQGGGVGFMCRKPFSPSVVTSPDIRSFKSKFDHNNFVIACLYRLLGSCTTGFFLVLSTEFSGAK